MSERIHTFTPRGHDEEVRVRYVTEPNLVYAVVGDGDPWVIDRSSPDYDKAYVIAQATRYYKNVDGYSGWVVSGQANYTDPLPNKPEALRQLDFMVQDYIDRYGDKW